MTVITLNSREPRDPAEREREEARQRITDPLNAYYTERVTAVKRLAGAKQAPEQPYAVRDTSGHAPRGALIVSTETIRSYAVRHATDRLSTIDGEIARLEAALCAFDKADKR